MSEQPEQFDGFVLAGGKSSRMGRDKARLIYPDRWRMAVEVADTMAKVTQRVAIVRRGGSDVAWEDKAGVPIEVVFDSAGVSTHPLWGVAEALANASTRYVLIAPCDMPHLPVQAFRNLIDSTMHMHRGSVAVSAGGDGQVYPLLAVYPRAAAKHARKLAETGGSAREFAKGCIPVMMPEPWLVNINAPDDLQQGDDDVRLNREE